MLIYLRAEIPRKFLRGSARKYTRNSYTQANMRYMSLYSLSAEIHSNTQVRGKLYNLRPDAEELFHAMNISTKIIMLKIVKYPKP